jgi:hypothetical protein
MEAAREYFRGFSFLMSEIRRQRGPARRHVDLEDEVT